MEKKQVLRILSVFFIIAGILVFVFGVMRYHKETSLQQNVLKQFQWDDNGQMNMDDVDIVIEGETESNSNDDQDVVDDDKNIDDSASVDANVDNAGNADNADNADNESGVDV